MAILDKIPALPFYADYTDRAYIVYLDGSPVFMIGLKEEGGIANPCYVWLEPFRKLSIRELRFLLGAAVELPPYCYCLVETPTAERFARFFGFRSIRTKNNVTIMERIA